MSETTITKYFAKRGHGLETADDSEEFLVQQPERSAYKFLGDVASTDRESVLIAKARDVPD